MPRIKVSLEELRIDLFNQIDNLKEKLKAYETYRSAVLAEKQSLSSQSVILEKTKEAADLISLYSQATFRTADQVAATERKKEKRRQEKIVQQQASKAELTAMHTAGLLAIKGLEMSITAYLSEGVLVANVNLVGERALGPCYFDLHSLKIDEWQREVKRIKDKLTEVFPYQLYPKLHQQFLKIVDKITAPTTLAVSSRSTTYSELSLALIREELFGQLRELKIFHNPSLQNKPDNSLLNQAELAKAHKIRIETVENNIRNYLSEGKLSSPLNSNFTESALMATKEMQALTNEEWQDECEIIRNAIRANSFPPTLRRALMGAIPDYRPTGELSSSPVPSYRPQIQARAEVKVSHSSVFTRPAQAAPCCSQVKRHSTSEASLPSERASVLVSATERTTSSTMGTSTYEAPLVKDLKQMFQARVIELLNQPAKPSYFASFFQARKAAKQAFLNELSTILTSKTGIELHKELRNFIVRTKTGPNYSQIVAGYISHRVWDLINDIEMNLNASNSAVLGAVE